ncbi:MAG: hypothetical protein A2511_15885 [Deltaproteobacteria bacterium RIFOXYD12_FULL_50_9]|nr:MAG: hypothetical protein A2511_15885 [Deltaproteobacteria bacterium RIFOXYD12_FULL_50_9]
MIIKALRIIGRSSIDFLRDDGLMLAGALSYFTMMTMVPFCLFLITVFGHFLGQYPGLYQFFLAKLTNFFPSVTQEITNDLGKIIGLQGLGKYSLLLYGFLSYQVFASLEVALNTIFKVKKRRGFVFSILVSLLVVALIIALLTTAFTAASLIPLLNTMDPGLAFLRLGRISKFLVQYFVPFGLVLLSTSLLYKIVPKTGVNPRAALKGAFFTAVLLEIAKHLFTWFVSSVAQYGKIYGPLSAFILFLLWMFYASVIFLIGAKIVYNLENRKW